MKFTSECYVVFAALFVGWHAKRMNCILMFTYMFLSRRVPSALASRQRLDRCSCAFLLVSFSAVRGSGFVASLKTARTHCSEENSARHFGRFLPRKGPANPSEVGVHVSAFFAALNLAIIETVIKHVNVHIEGHLISCYASLYRASLGSVYTRGGFRGASKMRRNNGDAAAHLSTTHRTTHTHTYQH